MVIVATNPPHNIKTGFFFLILIKEYFYKFLQDISYIMCSKWQVFVNCKYIGGGCVITFFYHCTHSILCSIRTGSYSNSTFGINISQPWTLSGYPSVVCGEFSEGLWRMLPNVEILPLDYVIKAKDREAPRL